MTTTDTRIASPHPSDVPARARRIPSHEHAWVTRSRHPTSDGDVLYVRCIRCGTQRIDLQSRPHLPATAATELIAAVGNKRPSPRVEPGRLKSV